MSTMARLNLEDGIKMISFSDFYNLSESFKPKETDFGTDGKDGKWEENATHRWTLFSHKPDHHVMVHISKYNGEFGFGTHRGEFTKDVVNHYDESPKHVGDALSVMNKAIHVVLHGAMTHNVNHLFMKGANENLKTVYSKAMSNKFLQDHLNNYGFKHTSSFRDEHHFEKI